MIRVQQIAQPVVPDPKPRTRQVQRITHDPAPVRQPTAECKTTEKRKTVSVTVRLSADTLAKIDAEAKVLKLNRTQTIAAMLGGYYK